jgi:hypothetical protein
MKLMTLAMAAMLATLILVSGVAFAPAEARPVDTGSSSVGSSELSERTTTFDRLTPRLDSTRQ